MKIIFLILFILVGCSGEDGGKSSTKISNPLPDQPESETELPPIPEIPLTLTLSMQPLQPTQSIEIILQLKSNLENVEVDFFSDPMCLNLKKTQSLINLNQAVSWSLIPNQVNEIYVSAKKQNQFLLDCVKLGEVTHDSIAPENPFSAYFWNQNGNTFLNYVITGGDPADFSEPVSKIKYFNFLTYNDPNPTLIKEVSTAEYFNKQVELPLVNEENYFKITAVDLAGNESEFGNLVIFNKVNSTLAEPVLNYEIATFNNKKINQNEILLKGIVSSTATSVEIYRDSNLNNLAADISAETFMTQGVSLSLNKNQTNAFFLIAKNSNTSSLPISFTVIQDNIAPAAPILDSWVYSDSIYELSENVAEITGVFDLDAVSVVVYLDPALTQTYASANVDAGSFLVEPLFYKYGYNTFYLVAFDEAGNASPSVEVTLEYLDYDLP